MQVTRGTARLPYRTNVNDSADTWTDLSGNGRNGTLTNGAFYNNSNGGSLQFDGVNDYVSVPNFNINSFTVCSFIKLNVLNTFKGIFGQSDTIWNNTSVAFRVLDTNKLNLLLSASGTTSTYSEITSDATFLADTWYFVAASFDKPNRKLYINGESVSYTITGITNFDYNLYSSTSPIIIGGYTFGAGLSYLMNGNIPLIYYYNRALSETEIKQNFNALRGRFGI